MRSGYCKQCGKYCDQLLIGDFCSDSCSNRYYHQKEMERMNAQRQQQAQEEQARRDKIKTAATVAAAIELHKQTELQEEAQRQAQREAVAQQQQRESLAQSYGFKNNAEAVYWANKSNSDSYEDAFAAYQKDLKDKEKKQREEIQSMMRVQKYRYNKYEERRNKLTEEEKVLEDKINKVYFKMEEPDQYVLKYSNIADVLLLVLIFLGGIFGLVFKKICPRFFLGYFSSFFVFLNLSGVVFGLLRICIWKSVVNKIVKRIKKLPKNNNFYFGLPYIEVTPGVIKFCATFLLSMAGAFIVKRLIGGVPGVIVAILVFLIQFVYIFICMMEDMGYSIKYSDMLLYKYFYSKVNLYSVSNRMDSYEICFYNNVRNRKENRIIKMMQRGNKNAEKKVQNLTIMNYLDGGKIQTPRAKRGLWYKLFSEDSMNSNIGVAFSFAIAPLCIVLLLVLRRFMHIPFLYYIAIPLIVVFTWEDIVNIYNLISWKKRITEFVGFINKDSKETFKIPYLLAPHYILLFSYLLFLTIIVLVFEMNFGVAAMFISLAVGLIILWIFDCGKKLNTDFDFSCYRYGSKNPTDNFSIGGKIGFDMLVKYFFTKDVLNCKCMEFAKDNLQRIEKDKKEKEYNKNLRKNDD